MGLQGRAFVESHHSWDASCSRLEGMLLTLVRPGAQLDRMPA
jgi:hypothetical protein